MITPSHLVYGWAAARGLDSKLGEDKLRVAGMVIGSALPDMPAYTFFIYHTFIAGTAQSEMWNVLYFEGNFVPFITLSHSFLLWPALLAISYAFGRKLLFWVAAGAILHSIMDFTVHVDDAYRHFWPISDWQWKSYVSYWDPRYYGNIVGLIDTAAILLLLTWLFHKVTNKKLRYLITGIALLYLTITIISLTGTHPHHGQ